MAKFIFELWDWITSKVKVLNKPYLFYVFVAILLAPSAFLAIKSSYLFAQEDTRLTAYKWVKSNIVEEKDFVYVVGENLENVPFQVNNTEKIKKLDRSNIKVNAPFFVIIGMEGVTQKDLTEGDRDPDVLKGNSSPILKDAELVFSEENKMRMGPPIFIFRVNSVESN